VVVMLLGELLKSLRDGWHRGHPGHHVQSVFPHQLRPGDIVTDDQGEWEVIGYPSVYNQGKSHQVRVEKPGDPQHQVAQLLPRAREVKVKPRGQGEAAPRPTRTELLVRDGDGKLVYRFTLPCDPVADPTYLAALVAGPGRRHRVRAVGGREGVLREDARRGTGMGGGGKEGATVGRPAMIHFRRGSSDAMHCELISALARALAKVRAFSLSIVGWAFFANSAWAA
jgi:hypothetical protein